MYFDNLHEVLTMGGHGGYVWIAYAVTSVVLALVLVAPVRRRKRVLLQLAGELRRAQDASHVQPIVDQ